MEVRRIAEHVQVDADLMAELKAAGIVPGHDVEVRSIARFGDAVPVVSAEGTASGGPADRARRAGARALTAAAPRSPVLAPGQLGLCHRKAGPAQEEDLT